MIVGNGFRISGARRLCGQARPVCFLLERNDRCDSATGNLHGPVQEFQFVYRMWGAGTLKSSPKEIGAENYLRQTTNLQKYPLPKNRAIQRISA